MAAITHLQAELRLVAIGSASEVALWSPLTGEHHTCASSSRIVFDKDGWAKLVCDDVSTSVKNIMHLKVFVGEAGLYIYNTLSKATNWCTQLLKTHTWCYPTLQVSGVEWKIEICKLGCPRHGSSCFIPLRPIQEWDG